LKEEIKVVAIKDGIRTKRRPMTNSNKNNTATKEVDDQSPPGMVTAQQVRSAQANLLAVAIEDDQPHLDDGTVYVNDKYADASDIMDMITPQETYVTGPPKWRTGDQDQNLIEGPSKEERDAHWKRLRGEAREASK